MANKCKFGFTKCLKTEIDRVRVYLYHSFDLTHGKGWFCHSYTDFNNSFGFSKNRFTAVRKAIEPLKR